ncbi:MAG TPA: hypothetical protein PLE13_12885 [Solirubrobacterales bacterium]|nr:hypothetical protein [Solirubrobacterales bacterium]
MSSPPDQWKWPDFGAPELVERLLMAEDAFFELWVGLAGQMPARQYSDEVLELATGYPWPRPDGSFVLAEGEGRLLADLGHDRRISLLEDFTGPASGRTPMLAIGSNASPEGLWRKLAHFPDQADRTLLAVSGRLHDFDVGASAELALYGSMPATIFPSPGTRVRATALWLTGAQLTQLAWAEVPYWIGRLEARFEAEEALVELGFGGFGQSLVFVNRFGTFAPDGQSLALAAIEAERRTAPALTQVELLDRLAEVAYGPGLTGEDLVRRACENLGEVGPRVSEALRSKSIPFESDRWTPFPG